MAVHKTFIVGPERNPCYSDREKVIKGLAACMPQTEEDAAIGHDGCPYNGNPCGGDYQDNDHVNLPVRMIEDIRALLKEQEPVKPVVDIDTWKCGNCGHTLEHQELLGDNALFHEQYNFCPECGRPVKWDD